MAIRARVPSLEQAFPMASTLTDSLMLATVDRVLILVATLPGVVWTVPPRPSVRDSAGILPPASLSPRVL